MILIYHYNESEDRYELKRDFQVKHSIMGLLSFNLTLNCSNDLIILTLNGIHVFQYDPDFVINLINQKRLGSSSSSSSGTEQSPLSTKL